MAWNSLEILLARCPVPLSRVKCLLLLGVQLGLSFFRTRGQEEQERGFGTQWRKVGGSVRGAQGSGSAGSEDTPDRLSRSFFGGGEAAMLSVGP